MSTFRVGQKVVAVDLRCSDGYPFGIKKGQIYEVAGFSENCCTEHILLKGINSGSRKLCDCNKSHPTNTFKASRFRPIIDESFGERICAEITEQVKQEQLIEV